MKTLRLGLSGLLVAALLVSAGQIATGGGGQKDKEGWVQLFNGKDLTNWVPVGQEKWTVEDGAIHGQGVTSAYGYLRTEKKYKDFWLSLRFKCEADGNSGICVTTRDHAKELSTDKNIEVQLVSFGYARTKKAYMAAAVAPSAQMALDSAGIKVSDLKAVKTHNPFAANDIAMAKTLGLDVNSMNNYGSSLIFGHPQAATGARLMIEGIEELVQKGSGYLLFSGCAAGDTAASIVIKVG